MSIYLSIQSYFEALRDFGGLGICLLKTNLYSPGSRLFVAVIRCKSGYTIILSTGSAYKGPEICMFVMLIATLLLSSRVISFMFLKTSLQTQCW